MGVVKYESIEPLQEKIHFMSSEKSLAKKIWLVVGILVVLGLIAALVYEGYSYYKVREALDTSEQEKQQLKIDLAETQQKFDEQQALLMQITNEKDQLLSEKSKLLADSEELKGKLAKLQEDFDKAKLENERLAGEIGDLKEDLRLWNGDVKDLKEVKLVVERRRRSVHKLRSRVWDIKVQVQAEIDRVETEMGNQGYLVKNGKPTPVPGAIELEKIVVTQPAAK